MTETTRRELGVSIGLLCLGLLFVESAAAEGVAEWKAGAASVAITPEGPMWMAGYAARDKPSEGKVHDLFAKALAVEAERIEMKRRVR